MTDAVTVPAPAKLNLFLRVLAREADGYHGLETLFCRVALADTLEARRGPGTGVTIDVTGDDVGPPENNLAVRAAEMVLAAIRSPFAVHLTLTKRIPVGAGLGGGSSDAAAALTAVNALASDAVPRHELLQFAARLGADVPFLFAGAPLALGWGRGDRLLALPVLPPAPVLIVVPANGVGTAEAYGWLDEGERGMRRGAVALNLEALAAWGSLARLAGNDFEGPVFARRPDIRGAFEGLAATGPLLCRMSGSGSAVFGVYRTAGDRDEAALRLGKRFGRLIATATT